MDAEIMLLTRAWRADPSCENASALLHAMERVGRLAPMPDPNKPRPEALSIEETGSNWVQIRTDEGRFLFSYGTVVAYVTSATMDVRVAFVARSRTPTTSNHVGKFLRRVGFHGGLKDPAVRPVASSDLEDCARLVSYVFASK